MSEIEQLKNIFPDIDDEIISVVLSSNDNNLDRSINALLTMSDPNYKPDPNEQPANQESQDEVLARQIAAEEDARFRRHQQYQQQLQQQQQQRPQQQQQDHMQEQQMSSRQGGGNFMEEELPQIKENVQQAFNVTKSKVTQWYNQIRERTSAATKQTDDEHDHHRIGTSTMGSFYDSKRREKQGYSNNPAFQYREDDADNHMLSEDFSNLQISGNSSIVPPKPPRPVDKGDRNMSTPRAYDINEGPLRPLAKPNLLSSNKSETEVEKGDLRNVKSDAIIASAKADEEEANKDTKDLDMEAAIKASLEDQKKQVVKNNEDNINGEMGEDLIDSSNTKGKAPITTNVEKENSSSNSPIKSKELEEVNEEEESRVKNPFEEDEDFKNLEINSERLKESIKNPFEEDEKEKLEKA